MKSHRKTEILIAGAGIVGSLMAIALAEVGFEVTLVDPSLGKTVNDKGLSRSYAISRASKRLLENLEIWGSVESKSEPIKRIVLSESDSKTFDIKRLAEFDLPINSEEPSSYMIEDPTIREALICKIKRSENLRIITNCKVSSEKVEKGKTTIGLENGEETSTALFIICDGPKSSLAKGFNKRFIRKDYDQVAIVTNVKHKNEHKGEAHQIFYSGGPLALLPLNDNRSAIVWSEEKKKGLEIGSLSNDVFLRELKAKIDPILVNIKLDTEKYIFPLSLQILTECVDERRVFIGDSAQTIHPLAGQGLNLGLRDIASLTETLKYGKMIGEDVGSVGLLKRYEQWRSFDRLLLSSYTDGINTLFSNNNKILRSLRRLGLKTINASTSLKNIFMNEAAGEYGQLPELLKKN